jgi:hydrogenase-1 operon protein HyaF
MEKFRLPIAGGPSEDDGAALLGLPLLAPALALPRAAEVSDEAREVLVALRDALANKHAADPTSVFSLSGAALVRELSDALGAGEVELEVEGSAFYRATETALPGVWLVRTIDRDGGLRAVHLEVGELPRVVRAANAQGTFASLEVSEPGEGLMNAPPLLTEIAHVMQKPVERGRPNHVINLTLLPVTDEDVAHLGERLGRGPVEGQSQGYGRCRVRLTAQRNVWSVTYFNSMGTTILDTIEIGDVPTALLAADEDLQDSAERLNDLLGDVG